MAQVTVTLADGLTDTGYAYNATATTGTSYVSPWNAENSYLSGGYTSAGSNIPSVIRAARVTNLQLRLGGTYAGYSGTADGFLQISTTTSGGSTFGGPIGLTATTQTYNSGTISHNIDTELTYYYGFLCSSGSGSNFLFARSGDGTGNTYKNGTQTHSGSISGQAIYQTIPSKPQSISASNVSQNTFTLNWTAPADDGVQNPAAYSAANIRGYRIAYKANATTAWLVYGTGNTGSSALTASITGLSTGTKYDFQVSALNAVTESHNAPSTNISAIVGERSNILTLTTLTSAPKVWNGSAWTATTLRVWNGTAWTSADIKVWNGTAWVPLIT
jgi:hypothetical protein